MPGYQRLSGLDASFLYLETAVQPLHVCSVLELDASTIPGGYSFDRLKETLGQRIRAMPEFREKLSDSPLNLDHPVWVDDEDFDVERHLHRIGLPAPGGRNELAEICGHIASLPLDRSRPLWEMWVIENIAGTDAYNGGRLAVMTKVHHAGVDGVTGANLMSQLCTTEADAPAPEPVEGVGTASELEIVVRGAVKFIARPLKLANVLPSTATTVIDTVRRAAKGLTMAAPFAAPKTAFNANVTAPDSLVEKVWLPPDERPCSNRPFQWLSPTPTVADAELATPSFTRKPMLTTFGSSLVQKQVMFQPSLLEFTVTELALNVRVPVGGPPYTGAVSGHAVAINAVDTSTPVSAPLVRNLFICPPHCPAHNSG